MIHTHAVNEQEKPTHDRKWLPFLLIVAASALAHLWCLRSQFYLDDLWQIRDNDYIRETRLGESFMLSWFYLSLIAQVKIFGMSSVGIHAVNWLLHTAIALVIYFSARDYLRSSAYKQAALFGALLFAVHPLGSEIPNYARAQDLAWVTLFSLLTAWMFFRFQHQKNWRYLIFSLLCIMGATCSKGPGLFHALMMVGVVGVAMMSAQYATFLHRHRRRIWIIVGMITVIFAITFPINPWLKLTWDWSSPRFVGHAFTVARVFWEFTWRGFVPIHLSADHHIAETLVRPGQGWWGIADVNAWVSMLGMLLFAAVSLLLWWRRSTRIFGMCLLLYVGSMLLRFLYFVPEYMPEYRIYPGLPWFCLALAIALAVTWRWLTAAKGWLPASIIILSLSFLSAKRSFQWHDLHVLMADVLEQYPGQMRAIWVMQRHDIDAGNWQAVIDRHEKIYPKVRERFFSELRAVGPIRELPTGHFALEEVGCTGIYARAVAHQKGPVAGLLVINDLEKYMQALRLDPIDHLQHWNLFAHMKGLVLEAGGDNAGAADWLERGGAVHDGKLDLERVRAKMH
jgi:hypothetical protein